MKSAAVVALALLESAQAFQAPALKATRSVSKAQMFSEGDIGVLPPLGVYDPLGLIDTRDMFRYEVMEIKHGRAAMPTFAWLQIMLTTCMMESGYFLFEAQTTDAAPGDIGGDAWVRYDDPEAKTFKLNVERQNGRAAMLGITGIILHELLGVDGLYPTGGLALGAAPPTIF